MQLLPALLGTALARFIVRLEEPKPVLLQLALEPETTCLQKSAEMDGWTLTDFDYHASYIFSTPAHQNSWGYISFNVSNPVLNYTVACDAVSSRLNDFFYGEQAYTCNPPAGESAATNFTWSYPDRALTLNQSWTCDDNPKYPARFTARGDAVVNNLKCWETFWKNNNWTLGQVYSQRDIKCDIITLPTPMKQIYGIA
ncbi:hypothetical protein CTA2_12245 [Colletotrichum tanaceti]|uniref:AA1-like domain-containing protein n=1 Tax=Colletotrichum tanaceti TaxID=1306861 RepID=A0A4V6DI49_9PEZI|nr:hypothetical protein CTA2_12245 [Colletotrichum tanaceti]TKW59126.1 hypothetical protein CTA1_927 [Colletotrichum tanaceti]